MTVTKRNLSERIESANKIAGSHPNWVKVNEKFEGGDNARNVFSSHSTRSFSTTDGRQKKYS